MMKLLVGLYKIFDLQLNEPKSFGIYHIICILAVIGLTVMLCKLFGNADDAVVRKITSIVWIVILSFEVYKQLNYGFGVEDGRLVWDYAWYIFPFQFCSSPLYVLPFIAYSKNEKFREMCVAYMMTFSLFAGIAVMCYPNDVFVETAGINLQTMIHHGSQVMMGVFYIVRYRAKLNLKFFAGGVQLFIAIVAIAMVLNIAGYHILTACGIDETFNMFYISPYFACSLPLLSLVWEWVPYLVFVMVYFFGFILCAFIVYSAAKGILKGVTKALESRKEMCEHV